MRCSAVEAYVERGLDDVVAEDAEEGLRALAADREEFLSEKMKNF